MEEILTKYLIGMDPMIIVIAVIILIFIGWIIVKNRKIISVFFDDLYNRKKNKEELLQTIKNNQSAIKEIMDNRVRDREQSLTIQKELTDAQTKLSESIFKIGRASCRERV